MTSKKLAATLGTLGASGTAGTAAWQMGLFGKTNLENETAKEARINPEEVPSTHLPAAEDPEKTKVSTSPKQINAQGGEGGNQSTSQPAQANREGGSRTGGAAGNGDLFTPGPIFQGASVTDIKVISTDLTWEKTTKNDGKVLIEVKENDRTEWECQLEPVVIGRITQDDISSINEQTEELIKVLKEEGTKRSKFVENCYRSRTTNEKGNGETSAISLETIKDSSTGNKLKFKDLEKLWTEDFKGVDRISDEDEELVEEIQWKKIEEIKNETTGTVIIKPQNVRQDWTCSISGKATTNLASSAFKESGIKEILEKGEWNEGFPIEKKKYLIRNCARHNKKLEGLKIRVTGSSWEFENLEELLTGMYEIPSN